MYNVNNRQQTVAILNCECQSDHRIGHDALNQLCREEQARQEDKYYAYAHIAR